MSSASSPAASGSLPIRSEAELRALIGEPQPLTLAKLARLAARLYACRQLTYATARRMEAGGGRVEASLVKLLACRSAELITREALQLHGGSAVLLRDSDVRLRIAFQWLTERLPGIVGRQIKWNFTKFLIGRDGLPLRRYAPTTPPAKIEQHLLKALGAVRA